jgi:glycosyltransferase involved in cell wall biosynthesis
MESRHFTCFLFNDLESWERKFVEPILEALSQDVGIETIWVTEAQRRYFKTHRVGNYWVIARDWQKAIRFLSARHHLEGRLFVTILHSSQEQKKLYQLSFQNLFPILPKNTTLLVHAPLEYRFLKDIKNISESQLRLLNFPMPHLAEMKNPSASGSYRVGTFCDFTTESNVNFLLGVAHFITQKNSLLHFYILGKGPLYEHFSKMVKELKLEKRVSIVETVTDATIGFLDLFLYFPLRNYNFIPVILAGAYRLPVISADLPGIEKLIQNEKNGFVVPSYEIQAVGERVLELLGQEAKCLELGNSLFAHLEASFPLGEVVQDYRRLFFENRSTFDTRRVVAA